MKWIRGMGLGGSDIDHLMSICESLTQIPSHAGWNVIGPARYWDKDSYVVEIHCSADPNGSHKKLQIYWSPRGFLFKHSIYSYSDWDVISSPLEADWLTEEIQEWFALNLFRFIGPTLVQV